MKLGTVTKLDKRIKTTSKKFDDDVIVIFWIFGQFGTVRKPDYVFSNSNLFSWENGKQN